MASRLRDLGSSWYDRYLYARGSGSVADGRARTNHARVVGGAK
eukprot:CAMPEP_0206305678 /NCGR_PEP_ID=MMETSP0106_2-20121207/10394_1 /ASSEMBLY_ACC=CAM_ASM_000206 /TAXON_ID=81532 /ORGANISM="Acanthoeca-like sp., Strain 10tr" /LENGTH=42 /DNA_ID= /DNA_START= /DNA_END= /DNA_ORIENTATION=